eukprot:sb/3470860/
MVSDHYCCTYNTRPSVSCYKLPGRTYRHNKILQLLLSLQPPSSLSSNNDHLLSSQVTVEPTPSARVFVNGTAVAGKIRITTGARIVLGTQHVFRYNNPMEAAKLREQRSTTPTAMIGGGGTTENVGEHVDWYYAQREIFDKQGCSLTEMNNKTLISQNLLNFRFHTRGHVGGSNIILGLVHPPPPITSLNNITLI